MILAKFFRLYAPEPDAGGTDTVDRGDLLPSDDSDLDPDAPDAKIEVKDDPAVKELEAELEAETAEEVEEKEAKPKAKEARIPLSRHEAVLHKEREKRAELERQLAQYQKGSQIADMNADLTASENEIMALEKQYADLLTDGENDKAVAVMTKIRATERQMAEAKSDMKIHAAEVRATERARYNTALERIETALPTLNPDHDDYDEEAMNEVAELKSAYEMKGLTPTAALQKAVKLIVEPRTTKQEMATNTKPNVSEKDVAAERKTAAVTKAAKAVAATPPSLARTGLDSDKLGRGVDDAASVIKLSQGEFAKLSEDALAKLRGDEI